MRSIPVKIKSFSLSVLALCLFIDKAASAQTAEQACSRKTISAATDYLKIENTDSLGDNDIFVSRACKTWPYIENLELASFARESSVEYEKKLSILIVDKKTNKVISAYQDTIGEDAITHVGPSSLQLDTARYQLNKNTRAFGLIFNSDAPGVGCGEANWNNEMTLFVPEGRKLRPVLKMSMYLQKALKGCISVWSQDAVWENAVLSIAIGKTQTDGYADLLISASITTHSNSEKELDGDVSPRIEHYVLHYNGNEYKAESNAPWWMGKF